MTNKYGIVMVRSEQKGLVAVGYLASAVAKVRP